MSARPQPLAGRRPRTLLAPDDRRAAIIQAAAPVLAMYGPQATTAQLAAAAGVSEGTIFHVFEDKRALIDAVVAHVMRVDDVVAAIDETAGESGLRARMMRTAELVVERMLLAMPLVMKCGAPGENKHQPAAALRQAIARVLEPDAERFAQPVPFLASAFLGMCIASAQQAELEELTVPPPAELVALFLDGALVRGRRGRSRQAG